MIKRCQLPIGCLLGSLALTASAHDAEPNLRLGSVKTFQVVATIIAPQEARLSLDALKAPFIGILQKRGKKIDQNNYDNVVSTNVQIEGSGSHYSVALSFSYSEPCVAGRLKLKLTCSLWEHYELLKSFSTLEDAVNYSANTTKTAARLFDAEFDRN
ncbi:hypothetical protein [Candidatus Ferrigenium straubiae]|jgi:hypothetical protein|uniref:hypothetical protein n=1 Tax=Candidatus Ferrigenium straubiae TaxID=2919506 RepID=UPI003F4ADCB0